MTPEELAQLKALRAAARNPGVGSHSGPAADALLRQHADDLIELAEQALAPHRHVVVQLEFESDTPGVVLAVGPFATWETADVSANEFAVERGLTRGTDVQVCTLHAPGTAPGGSPPGTITFQSGGEAHVAVVSVPQDSVPTDQLVVDYGGVRYAISMAMGSIPDYPGVGYIARPVQP
jgi:hypothetical protein